MLTSFIERSSSEIIIEITMSNQQDQQDNNFAAAKESPMNENATNSSDIQNEIVNQTESTVETADINIVSVVSVLEAINDDCLLHIMKFLNIFDIVSLAATCKHLQNLAKAEIFPRKARKISIGTHFGTYKISTMLENPLTLDSLEFAFSHLGDFVVDLTIRCHLFLKVKSKIGRIYTVLKQCKNLETLQIIDFDFTFIETHGLQNIIEKFQYLKELNLLRSTGITNNWLQPLNGASKIDKLTLTAKNQISDNFCNNFKNLCNLTIDFDEHTAWRTDDLAKIFNNNRHCLKHLKLSRLYRFKYYEYVGVLITEKLPQLDYLAIEMQLIDKSHRLIELPHLTSLEIYSQHYYLSINPFLRKLSDNGIIQELKICYGVFDDEDMSVPPLIFNKLQRFCCSELINMSRFLKFMTRSQMPAIHSFELTQFKNEETNNLLKFIEAKRTLKFIRLNCNGSDPLVLIEFLRKIIPILKKSKREFLNFEVFPLKLGDEEVINIILIVAKS